MRKTIAIATWLCLSGVGPGVAAPGPPPQEAEAAVGGDETAEGKAPAQVDVEVVLSRYQGEQRVANLPYTLRLVEGGPGRQAQLRVGVELPIEVEEGVFQYKNVGTHIDCSAVATSDQREADRDRYELWLAIKHSGVVPSSPEVEAPFAGAPMFSTFQIESRVVLSNGERVELVGSTDPVTGEVMRIQVALRVP
jgi:hypothetical protein